VATAGALGFGFSKTRTLRHHVQSGASLQHTSRLKAIIGVRGHRQARRYQNTILQLPSTRTLRA
jgi:hypothetical protein